MHAGQSHTDYKELYEEQLTLTAALTHELTQLKKMIFGSRRERFIPAPDATKKDLQLHLILMPRP